jgi:hypothetical protein
MRLHAIFLLLALCACAPEQLGALSGDATTVDAETTRLVEQVVREFSEDPGAKVTALKLKDTIVCGMGDIDGRAVPFYVDLEDEEAFFGAAGADQDSIVSLACR